MLSGLRKSERATGFKTLKVSCLVMWRALYSYFNMRHILWNKTHLRHISLTLSVLHLSHNLLITNEDNVLNSL